MVSGCLVKIKEDLCSKSISSLPVLSTVAAFPWSCRYMCYFFDPGNILLVGFPKPLAPWSDISWGTWQYLTSSPHYFLDPGNISWTVFVMSLILVIFPEPGKVTSASYPDPPSHFLRPRWQSFSSRTSCHRHILCSVFLFYHQILKIIYPSSHFLRPRWQIALSIVFMVDLSTSALENVKWFTQTNQAIIVIFCFLGMFSHVSHVLVDCPTQLICIWIFICWVGSGNSIQGVVKCSSSYFRQEWTF